MRGLPQVAKWQPGPSLSEGRLESAAPRLGMINGGRDVPGGIGHPRIDRTSIGMPIPRV
jgi:hypothetical protein